MWRACLLFFLATVCVQRAQPLSPPWSVRAHKIAAVLQGDSHLNATVGEVELDGDWQIQLNITVLACTRKSCQRKRETKAQALATMLQPYGQMVSQQGAKMLVTTVYYDDEEVEPAEFPTDGGVAFHLMERILDGNRLYLKSVQKSGGMPPIDRWYLVFKPRVVQYWADNMSDLNGLESEVAAKVFQEVFSMTQFVGLLLAGTKKCSDSVC